MAQISHLDKEMLAHHEIGEERWERRWAGSESKTTRNWGGGPRADWRKEEKLGIQAEV